MLNNTGYMEKLRIVDTRIEKTIGRIEKSSDSQISCRKGCAHCCSMLVEISDDEARLLADWVRKLPTQKRRAYIRRISRAAADRREFFARRASTRYMCGPTGQSRDISDKAAAEYFHEKRRTCPFLIDNACSAYQIRPTSCRMHMVTSPPELCSRKNVDGESFIVPDEVETLREQIETEVLEDKEDYRWGELSIMVEHALREADSLKEY